MLLTLFGEDEVDHAAAVFGVRSVLDERHHVGNLDRAFDRDHEFDRGAVGVLGAVGVEVVVKEDGNFAREAARVGRLLRNDRGEFVQLLEVVEGRPEVVERAAQGVVHGDGAGVAHEGGRRIEKAHHPFVLRVEQVLPSLRNGQTVERFGVDHQAHRAGVDRNPGAVGVLEARGHLLPAFALVVFDEPLVFGVDGKGNAEVGGVGDGIVRFGDDLRDGLAGILVVHRHFNAGFSLDDGKHRTPARPFGRAVVDDGALRIRGEGAGKTETLHEKGGGEEIASEGAARECHGGDP